MVTFSPDGATIVRFKSILGSHSLIKRNTNSFDVVAGSPAKFIKKIIMLIGENINGLHANMILNGLIKLLLIAELT